MAFDIREYLASFSSGSQPRIIPDRLSTTTKVVKQLSNLDFSARKVTKARLGSLVFQVNPTTMSFGGGAEWVEVKSAGLFHPIHQLGSMKSGTVSFEIYLNEGMTTKAVNAQKFVDTITAMSVSGKSYLLVLGSNPAKTVVIGDCTVQGEAFNSDLTIREARINVVLSTTGED